MSGPLPETPYSEKDAWTPTTESMSGTLNERSGVDLAGDAEKQANGTRELKMTPDGAVVMTNGDLAALEAQDKANHIGHWDANPHHPHEDNHVDEAGVRERDGTVVTFPDGGWRAWLVVLGAGHTLFCTFGFVNAWGTFQDYYTHKFPEQSASTICGYASELTSSGWIGSMQYLLIFLPSVVMGRLVDQGRFLPFFWAASLIYPFSIIITAEVTAFWQAILSHGILFGLSVGLLFCPAVAVTAQWFHRRRAFALGLVAVCSSLGGVCFPILVSRCLRLVGFKWTMRISGLLCLYCTMFASCVLRTRLPPKSLPGGVFNLRAFKLPYFACWVGACFFIQAGLYTPLSFLDVMGKGLGLGDYSVYLISIANAGSIIGRIGPAYIADKWGSVNFLIPGLVCSMVTTFAWPYATSKGSLTAVAVINGMFQGCFVSLVAPAIGALGSVEDNGRRFGMCNSVMAFGSLLNAPVCGAILEATSFHEVSYYAGSMLGAGVILMTISRSLFLKKFWGRI